jgi:hypothetical protein
MIIYRLITWRLVKGGGTLLTVRPSQLPSGAGLSFSVGNLDNLPSGQKIGLVKITLVDASQQCVG